MHEVEGRRVFNPLYSVFLDAPERETWQRPDEVIRALALPEGAVVADVGAGTGYFAVRFARAVGPRGRVLATDVQEEMLSRLEERRREEGLANLEVLRAGFDDPSLPAACCDLVFLANVYKEISGRVAWARRLLPALRPGGRLAVIDYRPEATGVGPPREVRLAEARVRAELAEAGFVSVASHGFLARQYFLVLAPLAERAGVVAAAGGGLVFATAAADLAPGDPVVLAEGPEAPAFRVERRLASAPGKAPAPLVLVRGVPAALYALAAAPAPAGAALPAVGVAGDATGLALLASRCAGREGLHLSLASGTDPAHRRLWSAYLLGSEGGPPCAERERAE
jgi:SAM-dependent methyltransferase